MFTHKDTHGSTRPRSTEKGAVGGCGVSLHGMMSRGVSVVVARSLMSIETKYEEEVARMDKKWQEKFDHVEESFRRQNQKLETVQEELKETKRELKKACDESSARTCEFELLCASLQQQSQKLADEVKAKQEESEQYLTEVDSAIALLITDVGVAVDQMNQHHNDFAATTADVESSLLAIDDAHKLLRSNYDKSAQDVEEMSKVMDNVKKQANDFADDRNSLQSILNQTIDLFNAKFDESVDLWTFQLEDISRQFYQVTSASLVTVEDHDALRAQLENRIKECHDKIDYLIRQKRDQAYELATAKSDATKAKRQLDIALKFVETTSENHFKDSPKREMTNCECVLDSVDCNVDVVEASDTKRTNVWKPSPEQRIVGGKQVFIGESEDGDDEYECLIYIGEQKIDAE